MSVILLYLQAIDRYEFHIIFVIDSPLLAHTLSTVPLMCAFVREKLYVKKYPLAMTVVCDRYCLTGHVLL